MSEYIVIYAVLIALSMGGAWRLLKDVDVSYFAKTGVFFLSAIAFSLLGRLFPIGAHHYNWIGKLFEILFCLYLIFKYRIRFEEVGFVVPKGIRLWIQILICAVASAVYTYLEAILLDGFREFDLESLLFQGSLPGIDEELFFRGVGFWLVAKAFPAKDGRPYWLAPIVITSAIFFYGHMAYGGGDEGSFSVTIPFQIVIPTIILSYVRVKTRSIVPDMLIHNLINLIPVLLGLVYPKL